MRKRLLKSLLCAVLSLSIVFPCAVFSPALAADSEIPVYFNGEKLVFDVPAQIIGDRTMVPLRAIFEAMGATVTWDPVTRTATGVRGDTTVVLPIGSLYPTINGIVVPLDVPAQIVDDRTLAPLRFVGEAFGGSVEWDEVTRSAHIAASDNVAELAGLSPVAVDFSLAAADLSCCRTDSPSNPAVRPGIDLTLKAKVYKNTPDAASGTVVFTLADSEVDRVPFAMDASDDYVTVKTYAFLNFDDFAGLTKDDTITSSFQAEVIPGDANYETNDADNTASKSVSVTGADIEPNENPAAAAVTLKTVGDLGENLTMPGEWLALKANVTGGNGYYTRVLFYVDGRLVGNKQCYVPKNGDPAVSSFSYFVPWSASGSLDLRVELEDGAEASLSVPVTPYDFQLRNQGIRWSGGTGAGDLVSIRCKLFKDSRVPFNPSDALQLTFLVNGTPLEPVTPTVDSATAPYMAEATAGYRVPENCSWPLDVRVVADAGGLFRETREGNNIAYATIPQEPEGVEGPSLSVAASDIWCIPAALVPGETVQLFAAVHNDSVSSASSMTLNFSVNGEQIDAANATYRDGIPGGQYHVFQEKWTVPEGLTADPLFTFAIIPGDSLAGDDTSDNFASLSLPLARPDLAVGQITALGADGGSLKNGFACELFAAVYNYGTSPAIGAELRFMIDGTTVATRTVDLPAHGAATVTVPYTVTGITDDTPVGSAITGISGSASLAGQGSLTYAVTVDPRNLVSENSETNNSAGPLTLPVTTGTSRGIVQVQVKTLGYDNISGATVTISASGRTASATTDSYGYCSFLDVPFGSYEVLARKSGYNDARSYDEILYEGNGSDYVCLYMDNYSYVSGVVTAGGTGLADVTVTVDGTSLQTKTNASGGYTLKVPVGAQLLKFRCVGYARSDKPVTVAAAQTTYMNVTMSATDLAYVYGWVMGTSGEDLPGMKVEAYRADGTVLATVYTGLDGRYDLNVPLYAPYTEDIGVRVTGQGLSATQGLFLHQGLEMRCDISFVPAAEGSGDILASVEAKVAPWTEFQYIPSTFWTEGVDISVIFGSFKLDTFVMATNSFIEHLDINTTPDYWLYSDVSTSWNPALDELGLNRDDLVAWTGDTYGPLAQYVAATYLPPDITWEYGMHSAAKTRVWIKKISILSNGEEACDPVYPDVLEDYAFAPNVQVNWDDCLIKYYLKVQPDHDAANPAAGYGYDRVLVVWNPKTKEITKIGHYVVVDWDEAYGREVYMDE